MASAAVPCDRCQQSVFAAEGVRVDGRTWHSVCFSCAECTRKLTIQTYYVSPHGQHGGLVFCKKCGPTMAPHTDSKGVDFKRAAAQKGGKLHNDQVRVIGTTSRRRPHSYFRRPSLDDDE